MATATPPTIPRSTAVPSPISGGIDRSPVAKDTTPVAASASTDGSEAMQNAAAKRGAAACGGTLAFFRCPGDIPCHHWMYESAEPL